VLRDLRDQHLRGDCLIWLHGCTAADQPRAAELVALGAEAGAAVVLSTARIAAGADLADAVDLVVAAGPVDRLSAGRLAAPRLVKSRS